MVFVRSAPSTTSITAPAITPVRLVTVPRKALVVGAGGGIGLGAGAGEDEQASIVATSKITPVDFSSRSIKYSTAASLPGATRASLRSFARTLRGLIVGDDADGRIEEFAGLFGDIVGR